MCVEHLESLENKLWLDGSRTSRGSEAYDSHSGLLVPNDGSVADRFAASSPQLSIIYSSLPDAGFPGDSNFVGLDQSQWNWQDNGYQDANEQSTSSQYGGFIEQYCA